MKKLACFIVLAFAAVAAAQTPQYLAGNGCKTFAVAGGKLQCASVQDATVLPLSFPLLWEGSSIGVGFNSQHDVYISAQTAGSGYSGTGTVTVTGGTCTTAPTLSAYVVPGGKLAFALTNAGACTAAPGASISGFTGGSGAALTLSLHPNPYTTPWTLKVTTLPAMNGRVSSFSNLSISGSTVFDVLGRYTTDSIATFCAQTNAIIAIDGGILGNSLAGGNGLPAGQGGTGSAEAPVLPGPLYSQWLALTHAYKNAGCKVIVTTMIPRGSGVNAPVTIALLEQYRQQTNNLIRTGAQGVDYDWLVDFGANVQDYNNAFIYGADTVHPTGAGQLVLAQLMDASLRQSGLSNALGAPQPVTGDQLMYGLSVSGNAQNYQVNGFAVGYASGAEYLTVTGPSLGIGNGYIVRTCDGPASSCNTILSADSAGKSTFTNGLGATGTNDNYLANGHYWGTSAGTDFQTETGSAPATRNPFTLRLCDSAGLNCATALSFASSGALLSPLCGTGSAACQTKRVTTCSTTSTQFNTCNTTVTWTTAFADTNYTATCTLDGSNVAGGIANTGTKAAASIVVSVINFTSGTALTAGTLNCTAVHD
jgi:hypothetical protein